MPAKPKLPKVDNIPPSPVRRERKGDRVFVSKGDEDRIMSAVPLVKPEMREYIRFNIAVAIEEYRIQMINERFHVSNASEIARARFTCRALREAADGLETLGRDAVLHHVYPTLADMDPPEDRNLLVAKLTELAESLESFLQGKKAKRGRERKEALPEFVDNLCCIYWDATRKPPGVSSKPEKKPGKGGLEYHGPFVRFCITVVKVANPAITESNIFELARRSVRRVRQIRIDRNFIPTDRF